MSDFIGQNLIARIFTLSLATLVLSSCGSSYLSKPAFMRGSYSDWKANAQIEGRRMLDEALVNSDVVSVRAHSGGIVRVFRNVELRDEQFCGDLIATWVPTPSERWKEEDRHGTVDNVCLDYSLAASVRNKDVRHCKGSDCLWLRGFLG